jgi:FkbM family methyltransferase
MLDQIKRTLVKTFNYSQGNFEQSVIFDFGAHTGKNILYYLNKASRVVAVEANPVLCEDMDRIYKKYVKQGRLKIINYVISEKSEERKRLNFYINDKKTFLSALKPMKDMKDFRAVELPAKHVDEIIAENLIDGESFILAKFDLEGFDAAAARDMFDAGYFPKYVSVECHDANALNVIRLTNKYNKFKIVDGESVRTEYKKTKIELPNKRKITFRFKHHSAGPFGEDINGQWRSYSEILDLFKELGFGWKDVCAKRF